MAWIFILAAIAAAAWAGYSFYAKKQRREATRLFAARYGLQYSQEDPLGLLGYPFHLMRMGDGRGCENVVYGQWKGLPASEADYWYYTESTDSKGNRSRTYHRFSIVIAQFEARMPYVSVTKESMFTRLVDHFGFPDIQFESEDFNRQFRVKAGDREFAFQLIDARMMHWMLSTGGGFGFEVQGSNILVYCRTLRPTELEQLFDATRLFHDHVPRLVWTEYGTGQTGGIPPPPDKSERSSS